MQCSPGSNGGFTAAPKPWERLQKGYEQANVQVETGNPQSLLSQYRRLIRLRAASPALQALTAHVFE